MRPGRGCQLLPYHRVGSSDGADSYLRFSGGTARWWPCGCVGPAAALCTDAGESCDHNRAAARLSVFLLVRSSPRRVHLSVHPRCAQRPVLIESLDPTQPGTLLCNSSVGLLAPAAVEVCGRNQLTLRNLILEGCGSQLLIQGLNASVVLRNVRIAPEKPDTTDAVVTAEGDVATGFAPAPMQPAIFCAGCTISLVNVDAANVTLAGTLFQGVDSRMFCARSSFDNLTSTAYVVASRVGGCPWQACKHAQSRRGGGGAYRGFCCVLVVIGRLRLVVVCLSGFR